MVESQFKGIRGAITEGPMADGLGLVVECFHRSVIDRNLNVAEDIVLVTANHPGELSHRLEP